MRGIRNITVLGAGIMGAGISGVLASAGFNVYLLDIVPDNVKEDKDKRSILAKEAKNKLLKQGDLRPAGVSERITPGNLEDDLDAIRRSDWIIEAVVERLDIKSELYNKISPYLQEDTVISSNTSGIPIKNLAESLPAEIRRRFMGVHFFNPPRVMRLVEIIPTDYTDAGLVQEMFSFLRNRLGKDVITTLDAPNFVANRIGLFALSNAARLGELYNIPFSQVDDLTGTRLGRSTAATYRTLDFIGFDTIRFISKSITSQLPGEEENYAFSSVLDQLIDLKYLGNKTGGGIYRTVIKPQKKVQVWDKDKCEYTDIDSVLPSWVSELPPKTAAHDFIKSALMSGTDTGKYVWETVRDTFLYAAFKADEICDDFRKIDLALKWGYNWTLGPFELCDKMGAEKTCQKYVEEGFELPLWVTEHLNKNNGCFYNEGDYDRMLGTDISIGRNKSCTSVRHTDEVSLYDLGDRVALIEFHASGNAINSTMVNTIISMLDTVNRSYDALVFGNEGKFFSGGANIAEFLEFSKNKDTKKADRAIEQFQNMTQGVKYLGKPVVAAPHGMALGGGFEICMHSTAILANSETKVGLVETGVGLVPGGGGLKEMAIRAAKADTLGEKLNTLLAYWEAVAFGKMSQNALDGFSMGYLCGQDRINMSRAAQLTEAKEFALSLKIGYRPSIQGKYKVSGDTGYGALKCKLDDMLEGGRILEYDSVLALQVAEIICGGRVPKGTLVSEKELLDMERETFVRLLMDARTRERIEYMLKTGKRLSN